MERFIVIARSRMNTCCSFGFFDQVNHMQIYFMLLNCTTVVHSICLLVLLLVHMHSCCVLLFNSLSAEKEPKQRDKEKSLLGAFHLNRDHSISCAVMSSSEHYWMVSAMHIYGMNYNLPVYLLFAAYGARNARIYVHYCRYKIALTRHEQRLRTRFS